MRISEISAGDLGGLDRIGLGALAPVQALPDEFGSDLGQVKQPNEAPSTMTKVLVFGAAALFLFWAWSKVKRSPEPRFAGLARWAGDAYEHPAPKKRKKRKSRKKRS